MRSVPSRSPPLQSPASASPARSGDNNLFMQQSSATFLNASFDRTPDHVSEETAFEDETAQPLSPGSTELCHRQDSSFPVERKLTKVHTSIPQTLLSRTLSEPDEQPPSSRPEICGELEGMKNDTTAPPAPLFGAGGHRAVLSPTHVSTSSHSPREHSSQQRHNENQGSPSDSGSSSLGDEGSHKVSERRKRKRGKKTNAVKYQESSGSFNDRTSLRSHRIATRSYLRIVRPSRWLAFAIAMSVVMLLGGLLSSWLTTDGVSESLRSLAVASNSPQWQLRNDVGVAAAVALVRRGLVDPLRRVSQLPAIVEYCAFPTNAALLTNLSQTLGNAILDDENGLPRMMRPGSFAFTACSIYCNSSLVASTNLCLQLFQGPNAHTVAVATSQCQQCFSTIDSTSIKLRGSILEGAVVPTSSVRVDLSLCFSSWATQSLFVESRGRTVPNFGYNTITSAVGLHIISVGGTKPLIASCTRPVAVDTLTLSLASNAVDGCISLRTPDENSTLCASGVAALIASTSLPRRLTDSLYVVGGDAAPLSMDSDVSFFSGPQLVEQASVRSVFVVHAPTVAPLSLSDACNAGLSHGISTADLLLWLLVPILLIGACVGVVWGALDLQNSFAFALHNAMQHVKVLCGEIQAQAQKKGMRELKGSKLHLSGSGDSMFESESAPPMAVDQDGPGVWSSDVLDSLAISCSEMAFYARTLVPEIRARFVYYQSFLRKTSCSSSRLPQIIPTRSSRSLHDLAAFQPLASVTSFTAARRIAAKHPSLFVQPASPEEMGSGMFSPSQGPRGQAFVFQLDQDASPVRVPSILPEAPRGTIDPNYVGDASGSPLCHTNSARLFTPRPPSHGPQSPMLSAGSPTGAGNASSNVSVGGWSPMPADLPHLETLQQPSATHPTVPPIIINRTVHQSLNVVQAHAMSMSVTSTAFLQSARIGKTPRLSTSAACSPAPGEGTSLLLPPGHRNKHFHTHQTPRTSYSAAGQDGFLHKRATVLTCSAYSKSFGRQPSLTLEHADSAEVQSPRPPLGKGLSSDSQRFLRTAIECADQCDGSVIEMSAFSLTLCWNGLSPYPFHEARAVQCAMHMAAQLDEHTPDIGYNIGVVTGGVLVGHIGTTRTMRRCVLGLSVYVSQLLPPLGRIINCSILVSEATYSMARSRLTCVPVEVALYDGQVMILYEAFGTKDEQSLKPRDLDLAHRGFAALCNSKFHEARGHYEELLMAGSTHHACGAPHAEVQFSRLGRVAASLGDEQARRMELSGFTEVSYGRNGPSWLIHEVAADHVRLPEDVMDAMGGASECEEDPQESFTASSRPLTPMSGHSTVAGHHRSPSGSRRSSVNPIFELRAELEQQLLERTVRASANSLLRSPNGALSGDDTVNTVPQLAAHMWSPDSRRSSSSLVFEVPTAPADASELIDIVDRRGQTWRRSTRCLGKGTFGEVYVGLQSDGSLCAIKIISLSMLMQQATANANATVQRRGSLSCRDRNAPAESSVSWGGVGTGVGGSGNNGLIVQGVTSLGSTADVNGPPSGSDGASILSHSQYQYDPGNAPPPCTPLNPSLCSPRPPPTSGLSREVDQLLQEVATLSSVKSDNVVRYFGSAITDGCICIVMEYVGGGSLTSLMGLFGTFPLPSARRFVMDILRGLRALHEKRIVHRDVGPNNVLVTIDGVCKLSDFGCSQSLHKMTHISTASRVVAGTPQYMAPEACRGEATTASDIWSLGVLAHVLVTGRLPFADVDLLLPPETFIRQLAQLRGGSNSRRPSSSKVSASSGDESSSSMSAAALPMSLCIQEALLPRDALEFVQVCLLREQSMRPSAEQLMMHPFVLK